MTAFTIYKLNGQIIKTGSCAEADLVFNVGDGLYLETASDPSSQYIKNGKLLDMPPRPIGEFIFNYDTEQWIFDNESAITKAKYQRDQLLQNGPDRVNPMWWASMSTADQMAVTEYRQALLDITQQPGYPMEITWPDLPDVFQ